MTSSAPLDLSVQRVRSADHDHDHDRNQNAQLQQQPQMSSRQLQLDKATRRARRGRRRPRPPENAAAICSEPVAASFSDRLSRQYDPPMFAELDSGVDECSDDRSKQPASWRMDENSPVSAVADDSGPVLAYGRRGKTGPMNFYVLTLLFYF